MYKIGKIIQCEALMLPIANKRNVQEKGLVSMPNFVV